MGHASRSAEEFLDLKVSAFFSNLYGVTNEYITSSHTSDFGMVGLDLLVEAPATMMATAESGGLLRGRAPGSGSESGSR